MPRSRLTRGRIASRRHILPIRFEGQYYRIINGDRFLKPIPVPLEARPVQISEQRSSDMSLKSYQAEFALWEIELGCVPVEYDVLYYPEYNEYWSVDSISWELQRTRYKLRCTLTGAPTRLVAAVEVNCLLDALTSNVSGSA